MLARILSAFTAALLLVGLSSPARADWYRADTQHFTIYSDGSERKLEEFAHEVEKFDALLRTIFNRPAKDGPNKLTIYVLSNSRQVGTLLGSRTVAGFYSPRITGSFAVANREHGSRKTDLDGQTILFHEYAHHFMFRNFSTPAPSWFVEGFAEYVSTVEFDKDGSWTFGKPANHRAFEVQYYGNVSVRRLLEGDSGDDNIKGFYGWSWALTHMLYSQEYQRGDLSSEYFKRLNAGEEPLAAAEASFGDLDDLQRDLRRYVRRSMSYSKSPKPMPYFDDIEVTRLSDVEGDTAELTMRRLSGYKLAKTRDDLAKIAARADAPAETFYQLAEAEYALAHRESAGEARYNFGAAHAAVDRALATDAGHVGANVLKGRLFLEPFDHEEMGENPDEGLWAQARKYFLAANKTDPLAPAPLYYYAQTFVRQGEDHEMINPALSSAFERIPEVREVRFAYAFDLARVGQHDLGIRILEVLAGNPHSGAGTREAIDVIRQMKEAGVTGTFRVFGEEEDFEEPEDDDEDEDGGEDGESALHRHEARIGA